MTSNLSAQPLRQIYPQPKRCERVQRRTALGNEIARRAYHAVPLVNVVLQRMRVRRTTTVLITSAIWAELGSPPEYERRTILKHLVASRAC